MWGGLCISPFAILCGSPLTPLVIFTFPWQVVQNFVQQVTQSAMRAGLSKDEAQKQERMRAERAAKKEAKIQVRDKIALALHLHCP